MGNEFYQGYKEIRERVVREPNRFFEKKNILVNGRSFNVYQFNFDEDIIDHAYEIACKKSNNVMDFDQAGNKRSEDVKFINCFKGILAETGAQLYLEAVLKLDNVERWDIERGNWNYSPEEYDVRILLENDRYLKCESRSSLSYKTTLSQFCEKCHVIASYTNAYKQTEGKNDLYFRPVYQYKDDIIQSNLKSKKKAADVTRSFVQDIEDGNISLYYVSGANQADVDAYKEPSTNNQGNTNYVNVPIIKCGDMDRFEGKVKELLVV